MDRFLHEFVNKICDLPVINSLKFAPRHFFAQRCQDIINYFPTYSAVRLYSKGTGVKNRLPAEFVFTPRLQPGTPPRSAPLPQSQHNLPFHQKILSWTSIRFPAGRSSAPGFGDRSFISSKGQHHIGQGTPFTVTSFQVSARPILAL
ncbi:UNVERIFIED_CONTAM: hypothetical protein FKN15_059372 [Acipenser sinensis]